MATRTAHNKNNSAVKRILQEARELANDPSTDYAAAPLEDDIFEWHCTMRGSPGTEFEGGLYHVRILLPAEYPFRPPSIMLLTPSGRFELNTKICISFTNYHEEQWQPAWGVRTAIIGLQGFFPLKGEMAVGVGAIECPASERRRLAQLSRDWTCPHCKVPNRELLPDPPAVAETVTAPPAPIEERIAPSPAQEFIARMPQPAPTPMAAAERPAPPELALTAAVTPFAPQMVVPAPQPQQQQHRQQDAITETQRTLYKIDGTIAVLLVGILYMVLKKLGFSPLSSLDF